ncbi:PAS domain-containing protein [Klebsiella pneumoniae]|nr:PAS domain-containing protein [Klebsiella pneumoniae]MCT9938115.1 PAS domain-containing protein [Klebsiella pneumoniae]MCT9942226.1 PAS domain-containing protein [Klebsiella pneumoniae]MCT9947353.1 PAS domain-containing protein [Klebsiella pneumoniae]MCT9953196.1 PAS domain-containing protein [Klebsiella pneumoniae]MCT9958676.1 PAS domain-containing protein [Klebsiella pneumoniae]
MRNSNKQVIGAMCINLDISDIYWWRKR